MSTVGEIESALRELPLEDVQEIARWLRNYLTEAEVATAKSGPQGNKTAANRQGTVKLPDYAARRRDKTLPNMVLVGREQERW